MSKPILWIVIPCYNEEAVLPITAPLFLQKINDLAARGLVSDRSPPKRLARECPL